MAKKAGTDTDLESDSEDFDDNDDFDTEEGRNEPHEAGDMAQDHKSKFANGEMPSTKGTSSFSSKYESLLSINYSLKGGERRRLEMKSKKSSHINTDTSSRNKTKPILIRRVSLFDHQLIHSKTF